MTSLSNREILKIEYMLWAVARLFNILTSHAYYFSVNNELNISRVYPIRDVLVVSVSTTKNLIYFIVQHVVQYMLKNIFFIIFADIRMFYIGVYRGQILFNWAGTFCNIYLYFAYNGDMYINNICKPQKNKQKTHTHRTNTIIIMFFAKSWLSHNPLLDDTHIWLPLGTHKMLQHN